MKRKKASYDIEEIKRRLRLEEVCAREGVVLESSGVGRMVGVCPFHAERTASFSVSIEEGTYHCFGCGQSGDVLSFLAGRMGRELTGAAFQEVLAHAASLAGVGPRVEGAEPLTEGGASAGEKPKRRRTLEEKGRPEVPGTRLMHTAEWAQLSRLRHGISVAAIVAAERDGRLLYGDWPLDEHGQANSRSMACWVVTDRAGWCAQWRTLSGRYFNETKRQKSWSTRNTGWVLGCADDHERPAEARRRVVLVEGGADMLAGYHFAEELGLLDEVCLCAVLGAGNLLCPESLAELAGRRVRIIADNDPEKEVPRVGATEPMKERPGWAAAAKWQAQLREAGCVVDVADFGEMFAPGEVGDLNDLIKRGYGDVEVGELFVF